MPAAAEVSFWVRPDGGEGMPDVEFTEEGFDMVKDGDELVRRADHHRVENELLGAAVGVQEEQLKVLEGIKRELENREDVDDHLQDQIDQLQYCLDTWPDELKDELREVVGADNSLKSGEGDIE